MTRIIHVNLWEVQAVRFSSSLTAVFANNPTDGNRQTDNHDTRENHEGNDTHVRLRCAGHRFQQYKEENEAETDGRDRDADKCDGVIE
jgi:hypothetical protein